MNKNLHTKVTLWETRHKEWIKTCTQKVPLWETRHKEWIKTCMQKVVYKMTIQGLELRNYSAEKITMCSSGSVTLYLVDSF